mmetsp:Transcript_9873/g.15900  ORF Transcript_9873/g.15900 Transcript_9873/m.15900 type:complete len:220 (+) Transcript_9873:175-834(+)
MEVLLVGPSRSGKTVLLSRLKSMCEFEGKKHRRKRSWMGSPRSKPLGTTPLNPGETCGIDFKELSYKGGNLRVREVGYPMRDCWHDFYETCSILIFVIDISDRYQIAPASSWLFDAVYHKDMQKKPIIVVLNKIDLPYLMAVDDVVELLQLEKIACHVNPKLDPTLREESREKIINVDISGHEKKQFANFSKFEVCAATGQGCEKLLEYLVNLAPRSSS